jgi:hypothetical protein
MNKNIGFAAASVLSLLVTPALAQGTNVVPSNYNAVFVGGTPIMRFRLASGGYSPHQRAVETQDRVNNLLGQGPILPADITTQQVGLDAEVLVKGQLLFTADAATARLNQMSSIALADHWADNMRGVLPGLTEAK